MSRSLESLSRSRNMDMARDPEGTSAYANKPKTFEEHMKEMKRNIEMLSSVPGWDDRKDSDSSSKEESIKEARDAVLEAFNKDDGNNDERITSCKNRVFKTEFGPRYDDQPNVFRTNEKSVYRVTGMDQIADIVNCGFVRPKEGKIKGGHENEVFWSVGGEKLNYVDERPILEASMDAVKDGQVGALSFDDLSAIWVINPENGKRENKLNDIRIMRRFMNKGDVVSVEDLEEKMKNGIKLSDISATF